MSVEVVGDEVGLVVLEVGVVLWIVVVIVCLIGVVYIFMVVEVL